MKKIFLSSMIALLALMVASTSALADIRIKQKQEGAGRSTVSEVAIKGKRQRSEMELGPGMKIVSLTQCDTRRMISINDAAKKYYVMSMDGEATADAAGSAIDVQTAVRPDQRKGGIITYTTAINDTGERQQMFGFTARHLKTSMTMESSPDACNQQKMKTETDGWYIDLEFGMDCGNSPAAQQRPMGGNTGCRDQIRSKQVGGGKLGYPVKVTTRMFDADGSEIYSSTTEVIELTRATLDPSLFEVPAGYTQAASYQEMFMPATATLSSSGQTNTVASSSNMESAGAAGAAALASKVASKPAGTIRIGVVGINNRTSESIDPSSLRDKLISSLTGSGVDAVAIYGQAPSEVTAEAKQKDCDFVLYTDVTNLLQSQSNKVGGFLGRAAGVGSLVKSRYESQVDFRLLPTGGESPVLQSKANAKEEGDAGVAVKSALDREAKAVIAAAKKK
jgi:hypothetical protein